MNTSRQRKLLYMGCIAALLLPIIWLGLPAGSNEKEFKGRLSELREQYELGESCLLYTSPSPRD